MQRGRSYLVAVAGVALALAACGGAQSDDDAQGTSELGETITDFIPGAMAFDPEGGEDQFRQQEQQVQEMIRECMAEQGFEYVPYVPNFDDEFYGGAESEEESVERYGLYISYDLLQQEQYSEEEIPPELADDPNFAIQEALSPEEQEAYYAALWGPEPDIDYESMTEDEINAFFETWEPEGCETAAYEDVFGGGGADQAFYEEFGEAMEDNYQSVESDPRIVELEEAWSK